MTKLDPPRTPEKRPARFLGLRPLWVSLHVGALVDEPSLIALSTSAVRVTPARSVDGIPCSAHSIASTSVIWTTALWPVVGEPHRERDRGVHGGVFTIEAPPDSTIPPKAWQQKKTPVVITSSERRHWSSGSQARAMKRYQRCFTSTSQGPRSPATFARSSTTPSPKVAGRRGRRHLPRSSSVRLRSLEVQLENCGPRSLAANSSRSHGDALRRPDDAHLAPSSCRLSWSLKSSSVMPSDREIAPIPLH